MGDTIATTGGDNDSVMMLNDTGKKPLNIIDAVSEIQQMFVQENEGARINENYFTTLNTIEFFEVGFKGAFVSGFIAAIFTPLAFAVVERMIPAFGVVEPSLFDRIYVFSMALFLHIGYSFFLGSLGNYYIGSITRQMIKWLVGGVITGALVKTFIIFILYHWLYLSAITPESVSGILSMFLDYLSEDTLYIIYELIMDVHSVLLPSAWFMVFATILFITIPTVSIGYGAWKYGRVNEDF